MRSAEQTALRTGRALAARGSLVIDKECDEKQIQLEGPSFSLQKSNSSTVLLVFERGQLKIVLHRVFLRFLFFRALNCQTITVGKLALKYICRILYTLG